MHFFDINFISEKSWEGFLNIIIVEKRITKKILNNRKARVGGARITPRLTRLSLGGT